MRKIAVNPNRALRRIAPALAAFALVAAGSGIAYATSSSPPVTTGDAFVSTANKTFLSSTGMVKTPVESLTLPAGNWIVHADDSVVGNVPDIARCWLEVPGLPETGHATQLVPYVATVSVTRGLKLSSPTVVTNECSHDSTVPTSDYFYVDPEATMWAHKVGSLTIITKQ